MSKEVIHPSVKPDLRNSQQSRYLEEEDEALSEIEDSPNKLSHRPLAKLLEKPGDSLTEEDVVEYINEARVEIFNKIEYTEQYDRNAWEVLTKQLEEEVN